MSDSTNVEPAAISCEQAQEDGIALLKSELSDDEERALFNHLRDCPNCRRELDRDRNLMMRLTTISSIPARPDFDDLLLARLAEEDAVDVVVMETTPTPAAIRARRGLRNTFPQPRSSEFPT